MKSLKFALLLAVVVALALTVSLARITPANASGPDRTDNKVLISGVPQGWAIQVAQPGSPFPRGPGNLPDSAGLVTAYAPIGKVSQVYLWDKVTNSYFLIATIAPSSTWPDTVISAPVPYASFLAPGLTASLSPGNVVPAIPVIPANPAPSSLVRPGQYVVRPGDTLGTIARQFGTTVGTLAAVNKISNPNLIFSGQVLTIPGAGQ
jgi:nucleoid-associated protein YgaU